MPPKKQTYAPISGDWAEFRQALLAMQENLQSTIHASFVELGVILADRLTQNNPLFNDNETEDDGSLFHNLFARNRNQDQEDRRRPARQHREDDDLMRPFAQRWESSFKIEVPEFHGGPRGEAFLDWIATVD